MYKNKLLQRYSSFSEVFSSSGCLKDTPQKIFPNTVHCKTIQNKYQASLRRGFMYKTNVLQTYSFWSEAFSSSVLFETFPTKEILKCRLLKNNTIKIAAEPSAWLRVQKKPFTKIFFLFASSGCLKLFHKTDHKIQISTKQLRGLYKNYGIFKTNFKPKKCAQKMMYQIAFCLIIF